MKLRDSILASTVLALLACGYTAGNPGKPKTDGGGGTQSPSTMVAGGGGGAVGTGTGSCATTPLPPVGNDTGQFVFEVAASVDPCSVSGYLVGQEKLFTVQMSAPGSYFIDKVPAGAQDFIIQGRPNGNALLDSSSTSTLGVRLSSIQIFDGKSVDQGNVALPPDGSITGKVIVNGQAQAAGVSVYIPGTGYIAMSAADGTYAISNVPSGTHDLYFDYTGYRRGQTDQLVVKSAQATSVPDMTLVIDTGATGFLTINGGATTSTSRTVNLTLGATDNATLMKISENESFEGASWTPLATSTTYTFATPGQKTLYAMFADANGLESSPYSSSITVDLIPDSSISVAVTNSPLVLPTSPVFNLTLAANSNAVEMIIASAADFSGASWTTMANSASYSFPNDNTSCGTKTLYVKFRDKDEFESSTTQLTVETDCFRALSAQGVNVSVPTSMAGPAQTVATYGQRIYTWPFVNGDANCSSLQNGQQADAGCAVGGAYYDLDANLGWQSIADAPQSTRGAASITFVGSKMLAFGGWAGWQGSNVLNGGMDFLGLNIYDPSSNLWSTSNASGGPAVRAGSVVVSTGTTMIVWGGFNYRQPWGFMTITDAFEYDPVADSWSSIPFGPFSSRDPRVMWNDFSVWTGTELYVFSGQGQCEGGGCDYSPNGAVAVYNKGSGQWRSLNITIHANDPVYFDGEIYFPLEKQKFDIASQQLVDWTPPADVAAPFAVVDGWLYSHGTMKMMPFEAFGP